MYIRELPYNEMREICKILDENDRFIELGRDHMQFDSHTIQTIKSNPSPSKELLELWDYHNHTIFELFILLGRMKLHQAMLIIQKFIDPKYYYLIKKAELEMLEQQQAENSEKILNCAQPSPLKIGGDNTPQPPQIYISRDDNETTPQQQQQQSPRSPLPPNSKTTLSAISFVSQSVAGAIPQISYEELMRATNNWDTTTILGRGGFGIVFKGTWKCTKVAIKRIEQKEANPDAYNEQIKQSITELHCLNACRHDNILPLYGYSIGGPQPCLVYQYMAGGSLEYRLHDRNHNKILNWQQRLDIAIGTARGLQFLHTIGEKPLVHGDIKSANILLDPNDMPRIGDFGLAREGPEYSYVKVSSIHGTRPYLPDEFLRLKKFSTKVDTYSFGIVLFEIATGQTAYSTRRQNRFLKDHVVDYEGDLMELKDSRAPPGGGGGESIFKSLIRVGQMCVNKNAKERPQMVTVLIQLEAVFLSMHRGSKSGASYGTSIS